MSEGSHPNKPQLSPAQIRMQILDAEVARDEAKTSLKKYAKARIESEEALKRIEENEKNAKTTIANAEALLVALEGQLKEAEDVAKKAKAS